MKRFVLIDDEAIVAEFNSKSARDAALKAASRNYEHIVLFEIDTRKVHIFRGHKEKVKTQTEFMTSKNIQYKSNVKKMASMKVDASKIDLGKSDDVDNLVTFINNM